jgi:hypothetical protein
MPPARTSTSTTHADQAPSPRISTRITVSSRQQQNATTQRRVRGRVRRSGRALQCLPCPTRPDDAASPCRGPRQMADTSPEMSAVPLSAVARGLQRMHKTRKGEMLATLHGHRHVAGRGTVCKVCWQCKHLVRLQPGQAPSAKVQAIAPPRLTRLYHTIDSQAPALHLRRHGTHPCSCSVSTLTKPRAPGGNA